MGKITLQITSDAFYYLKDGEDPLDESNLAEAEGIQSRFPRGFTIEEGWKPIEDRGLIEVTFSVPDIEYDRGMNACEGVRYLIKWTDDRHVDLWRENNNAGAEKYYGNFEVLTNNYGLEYFQIGDISKGKGLLFFIKDFTLDQ